MITIVSGIQAEQEAVIELCRVIDAVLVQDERISVLVIAQISGNRCQSVEFRARRGTSSPRTIPALPMLTSVTSF
jgi:hypothetical protein